MDRRTLLLGGTAALAAGTLPAFAQNAGDIRIGFTYPFSGAAATDDVCIWGQNGHAV
jgi:branched-chain amino acid transport system substrate-binding protein